MAARLDNAERRNRGRKEDSGGTVSGGGRQVCIGARTRKQGHGFRVVDERRLATYPSLPPHPTMAQVGGLQQCSTPPPLWLINCRPLC